MKMTIPLITVTAVMALNLTGCAAHPGAGALFTNNKAPITVTSNAAATKTGTSDTCTSILGLLATGDCSIASAKKNGGIKNVSTVDYERNNILGIVHSGKTDITGN